MTRILPAALLLLAWQAVAMEAPECVKRLDAHFSDSNLLVPWQLAEISSTKWEWATLAGRNPLVTFGDFDGDLQQDVAFLIVLNPAQTKAIGVCLSSTPGKVHFIENVECDAGIGTGTKGEKYYEGPERTVRRFRHDTVKASCGRDIGSDFFPYENGTFRKIPNEPC